MEDFQRQGRELGRYVDWEGFSIAETGVREDYGLGIFSIEETGVGEEFELGEISGSKEGS